MGQVLREMVQEKRDNPSPPWRVGNKYWSGDQILQVRAIVDDQVVFRRWDKRKDAWIYYTQSLWYMEGGGYVLRAKR